MIRKFVDKLKDKALYSSVAAKNFSLKQKSRNAAAWGYKTMREMNRNSGNLDLPKKLTRQAALTAISYYAGDLPGSEQAKIAKRLRVPDETFSKYDTAVIYPICTIPQVAGLLVSRITGAQQSENVAITNLVAGASVNAIRAYLAFVEKKPSVSVCAKAVASNAAYYSPKIKKTINEKGILDATKYAGQKITQKANNEIFIPLHKSTEELEGKLRNAFQQAKSEFKTTFALNPILENRLKF